jgi:hypothetical protein
VGSSAKPSQTIFVPDSEVRKLSAAHLITDELFRTGCETSASCKLSIQIKIVE